MAGFGGGTVVSCALHRTSDTVVAKAYFLDAPWGVGEVKTYKQ